jgi:hypothetical protein
MWGHWDGGFESTKQQDEDDFLHDWHGTIAEQWGLDIHAPPNRDLQSVATACHNLEERVRDVTGWRIAAISVVKRNTED